MEIAVRSQDRVSNFRLQARQRKSEIGSDWSGPVDPGEGRERRWEGLWFEKRVQNWVGWLLVDVSKKSVASLARKLKLHTVGKIEAVDGEAKTPRFTPSNRPVPATQHNTLPSRPPLLNRTRRYVWTRKERRLEVARWRGCPHPRPALHDDGQQHDGYEAEHGECQVCVFPPSLRYARSHLLEPDAKRVPSSPGALVLSQTSSRMLFAGVHRWCAAVWLAGAGQEGEVAAVPGAAASPCAADAADAAARPRSLDAAGEDCLAHGRCAALMYAFNVVLAVPDWSEAVRFAGVVLARLAAVEAGAEPKLAPVDAGARPAPADAGARPAPRARRRLPARRRSPR